MLVMEFALRVTTIGLLLFFYAMLSTSALDDIEHAHVTPKGDIYLAENKNDTLTASCEVTRGEPVWFLNGLRVSQSPPILSFITENNHSTIEAVITDMEFRNISCRAIDFYNGFIDVTTTTRQIKYYGFPNEVKHILVQANRIEWSRPSNMDSRINLFYNVTVVNISTGMIIYNKSVTKPRITLNVPECFEVYVTAINSAGSSKPANYSNSSICDGERVNTTMNDGEKVSNTTMNSGSKSLIGNISMALIFSCSLVVYFTLCFSSNL